MFCFWRRISFDRDNTLVQDYEVDPTPESVQQKVWTGSAESSGYHFNFWHWFEDAAAH